MSALVHKPRVPAPQPPPPPPDPGPTDAERQAALDKEKKLRVKATGRRSTIVTGGLGVPGQAAVSRKTLLGQ